MYWDDYIDDGYVDPDVEPSPSVAQLLPKLALPALRRLDLSRNDSRRADPTGSRRSRTSTRCRSARS